MLDTDSFGRTVGVDQGEPFLHTVKQADVRSELPELLAAQPDAGLVGLVKHQFHVGKHVTCVLTDCDAVTHPPEFFRRLADGLDESEFLHIAG